MRLLVVGTVAFDSVKTPFGEVDNVLGGSATYFSVAASYFADVSLVAVVGEDFPEEHLKLLREKNIDLKGLKRNLGKTFRWKGEYGFDLNQANTLDIQLNVLAEFSPILPDEYTDCDFVFLANVDPVLQSKVLDQVRRPRLVAMDTMNFWIKGKQEDLLKTLRRVDLVVINEGEARDLAKEVNLIRAAQWIQRHGPKTVVVKRGEYGALMFNGKTIFSAPAFPLETIFDPTGAGDSFAGGFMGYLANVNNLNEASLRQAMIFGSAMASFNVEDFSLNRLKDLTYEEILERFRLFKELTHFEETIVLH